MRTKGGVLHREFYFSGGALKAGPLIPEFEDLMARFAAETDLNKLAELTEEIDRFIYDEALSVFLCAPQALYTVNRHVNFVGYAATFELAETEVGEEHWSRNGGGREEDPGATGTVRRAAQRAAESVGLTDGSEREKEGGTT